jgi:hypothetical protein
MVVLLIRWAKHAMVLCRTLTEFAVIVPQLNYPNDSSYRKLSENFPVLRLPQ